MKKLAGLMLILCMLCSAAGAEAPAEAGEVRVPDLDLSEMSGTFVYAQIYQMTVEPQNYVDKVIRLRGYYDVFEDTETGKYYTACVVPDATACCAQGIEFVLPEDKYVYPDDYPLPGTDITVTGRFELYEENGTMYIHLAEAEMEAAEEGAE